MVRYGLPVDEDVALNLLNEIVSEFGSNSENHLDNLMVRLYNDPKIKLSREINPNKCVAAGVMGYHREKVKHFKLFKDVVKTLEKLRGLDIKTAIITDGSPKKQYEKILRLKLENLVDEIIISDEVAVRKPNSLLFSLFLDRFNLSGTEVIYVGDRLDKDILPAKIAGMYTVLIHRGTKHDPNLSKNTAKKTHGIRPDFHANNLYELFNIIKKLKEET